MFKNLICTVALVAATLGIACLNLTRYTIMAGRWPILTALNF